jgi:hypothetical protein
MEDITFFKEDKLGLIMCISRHAPLADTFTADGATLKLDNQKNGYKGVCVYQETPSTVQSGRWDDGINTYVNMQQNKTFVCAYWIDGKRYNVQTTTSAKH